MTNTFPNQALTDRDKIRQYGSVLKWKEHCVNSIVQYAYTLSGSPNTAFGPQYIDNIRKQSWYSLYNGEIDENSYSHVTHPQGTGMTFRDGDTDRTIPFTYPAEIRCYNIVKECVDLLRGEYSQRKLEFSITSSNEEQFDQKRHIETYLKVAEYQQQFIEAMNAYGIPTDDMMDSLQKKISLYKNNGKLVEEEIASDLLRYLIPRTGFKEKSIQAFFHLLCTDEIIYRITTHDGEANFRVVNPLFCWYSRPFNSIYIDESDMFCELRLLTVGQILDEYKEYLTDEHVYQLENMSRNNAPAYNNVTTTSFMPDNLIGWIQQGNMRFIPVWTVEWIGRRAIGKTVNRDTADYFMDPDNLNEKSENIKEKTQTKWVNQTWQGTRIGNGLFVNITPIEIDYRSFGNPTITSLSYTGICRSTLNTSHRSFVSHAEPYQKLYNILWYKIELLIALTKPPAMINDLAQIPKDMTMELQEYYANISGNLYIETSNMTELGLPNSFNQWKMLDRSALKDITVLLNVAQYVKNMWHELCGITEQRLGSVQNRETVGGVEKAISQSSSTTAPLLNIQSIADKRLLNKLLYAAKCIYKKGTKLELAIGDTVKLLEIHNDKLQFIDFGVEVSDSMEIREQMQKMEAVATEAVAAGQLELLDLWGILNSKDLFMLNAKLEASLKRKQEQQSKESEMQMKQAQEANQMNLQLKQAELQQNETANVRDNETKIKVKQMEIDAMFKNAEYESIRDLQQISMEEAKQQQTSVPKNLEKGLKEKEKEEKSSK